MSVAGAIIAAVAAAGAAVHGDQQAKKQKHIDSRNRQIDINNQERYARTGIQMKMNDARAAGIHPLYALGAQGPTYSSVSGGGSSGGADSFISDGIANMGQDIGRAVSATKTQEQKEMAALALSGARLEVEGKALENAVRAQQLTQLQGTTPAFPGDQKLIPGQGNSAIIKNNPMERSTTMKGRPDAEPGALPSQGWALNADGSLTPVPSKDVKERIEDSMIQEVGWAIRNNLLPNITGGSPPPGYYWNANLQAYSPKEGTIGGEGGPTKDWRSPFWQRKNAWRRNK